MAESLAAQCTLAAQDNRVAALRKTMDVIVKLQPEILSLGMRNTRGSYLTQTRDHTKHWVTPAGEESTSTHWQVPIYQGEKRWATLEISFTPQNSFVVLGYRISPFNVLLLFFAFISFIGFSIFMRRTLQHLDPSSVMPSRVKYAFDSLTEGIMLLDKKYRIILANTAFAEILGCHNKTLMGLNASNLGWVDPKTNRPTDELPWTRMMSQAEIISGVPINITTKSRGVLSFMAKVSPILDDKGKSRGALVTFNDVTALEKKNAELMKTIDLLQQSRSKIEQQNQELEVLATRDSLTDCLNRRSFFEKAEQCLSQAVKNEINISCMMIDLDLFKTINDKYGHVIGDKVIKYAASTLTSALREGDILCRYGGEEFCILLPNCDTENATVIAKRMSTRLIDNSDQAIPEAPGLHVSASFGISNLNSGVRDIEELIMHADDALYKAKEEGRNRVVCWESEKKVTSNKAGEVI